MPQTIKAYLQEPMTSQGVTIDQQIVDMSLYRVESYAMEYLLRGVRVRSALTNLIKNLTKKDILLVHSAAVLGDSLEQINVVLHQISAKGANLILLKEEVNTLGMSKPYVFDLIKEHYKEVVVPVKETMTQEESVWIKSLYE